MATKKIHTRIGTEVFVTEIEVPDEQPKRRNRNRKPKTQEVSLEAAPIEPNHEHS